MKNEKRLFQVREELFGNILPVDGEPHFRATGAIPSMRTINRFPKYFDFHGCGTLAFRPKEYVKLASGKRAVNFTLMLPVPHLRNVNDHYQEVALPFCTIEGNAIIIRHSQNGDLILVRRCFPILLEQGIVFFIPPRCMSNVTAYAHNRWHAGTPAQKRLADETRQEMIQERHDRKEGLW